MRIHQVDCASALMGRNPAAAKSRLEGGVCDGKGVDSAGFGEWSLEIADPGRNSRWAERVWRAGTADGIEDKPPEPKKGGCPLNCRLSSPFRIS